MALQINYPPFSNTTKALMDFGTGDAPTLNYQLPQKTAFTSYGDFYLPLSYDYFTNNARITPEIIYELQEFFNNPNAYLLSGSYSLLRENYSNYLDTIINIYNQQNSDKTIVTPTFNQYVENIVTDVNIENGYETASCLEFLSQYISHYKLELTKVSSYLSSNSKDLKSYLEKISSFPDDFKSYIFGYSSADVNTTNLEAFRVKLDFFIQNVLASSSKDTLSKMYPIYRYTYMDISNVPNWLGVEEFAQKLQDYSLMTVDSLGGFGVSQEFIKRPASFNPSNHCSEYEKFKPCLFVIEEYKTASFLGDYGAGKTVKTFTLLPDEKTTITIKSYTESKETQSKSESIMDSLTQNSSKEMENLVQGESHFEDKSDTTTGSTSTTESTKKVSAKAHVGFSIKFINVKASASADETTTAKNSSIKESKTARSQNVDNLSKALQKHSETCNANRKMEINTSSTGSVTSTETQNTVRTLVNQSSSRVINFVFRQLQQEYITITYLNSIQIAFSNGNAESFQTVPIQQLDDVLNELVIPEKHDEVRAMIVNRYLKVENYQDTPMPFLEKSEKHGYYRKVGSSTFEDERIEAKEGDATANPVILPAAEVPPPIRYGVLDRYQHYDSEGNPKFPIYVNGIILNVDSNILRTDSVIVDSLLGTGEALDEFNLKSQEAKVQALYLDNLKLDKAISVLEQVPNPIQRADLFGKIFNPPITVVRN